VWRYRGVSSRHDRVEGEFRYEHPIEVRFVDTDALGHVNNAVYLSYFEAARAGYYAAVTGAPFGTGAQAARTFVIAEARLMYRAPAFFGETLLVGCRFAWTTRSSFGLEYRVRAEQSVVGPARLVADGETVQVMFDLEHNRVVRVPADLLEEFEAYEGKPIPRR
jgi:acyl-CoA thioester hydrolase